MNASAAQNCDAVRQCVGLTAVDCASPGDHIDCVDAGTDLRVECGTDAGALIEDCALAGHACIASDAEAACGPSGPAIDCANQLSNCGTTKATIHVCADDGGAPIGIDCIDNGGQTCAAFPAPVPAWVACVPAAGDAAEPACDASLSIVCANGVAHSCATGIAESIDCASLLDNPDACAGGEVAGGFDWTSGCSLGTSCPPDSCVGTVVTSCARGATFTVDCATVGLDGGCHLVTTDEGVSTRAACSPL